MIELRNVRKQYGRLVAVKDVSLEVAPGDACGLVGPNGAGKTTSLKMLATLCMPDWGEVFVAGFDALEEPRAVRRRIGFMPDTLTVHANMQVAHFMDYHAACRGLRGRERVTRVGDVLDLVDLTGKADDPVSALSKGMRQRLGLARVLLHDPDVLLLDEPAAGLDPRARIELRGLLRELRTMGKTLLFSSHILRELEDVCDTVAVMEKGALIAHAPIEELSRRLRPHPEAVIRLAADGDGHAAAGDALAALEMVERVVRDERSLRVHARPGCEDFGPVLHALLEGGWSVRHFSVEVADLEEVFLEVTKGLVQ